MPTNGIYLGSTPLDKVHISHRDGDAEDHFPEEQAPLHTVSTLNLAGSGLYLLVVLASTSAAYTAKRARQPAWHFRAWALIAIFFVLLIGSRLLAIEEVLRDLLRSSLRDSNGYDSRRELQRPLVAALVALAATGSFFYLYWVSQAIRGRRNLATLSAILGCGAMLFLIALRMTSLHAVDALLYGPLKLNWLADIGISGALLVGAAYYLKIGKTRK